MKSRFRINGTCTNNVQCCCRFHACCLRHGANATAACGAGAALVAPVLAAPAVCAPGQLLRCAAPPPAAPVPLGAAMPMGCDGAQRARVLPLHPQGSPAAGGHLKMPSWWPAMAHRCPGLHWGHWCEPLEFFSRQSQCLAHNPLISIAQRAHMPIFSTKFKH